MAGNSKKKWPEMQKDDANSTKPARAAGKGEEDPVGKKTDGFV